MAWPGRAACTQGRWCQVPPARHVAAWAGKGGGGKPKKGKKDDSALMLLDHNVSVRRCSSARVIPCERPMGGLILLFLLCGGSTLGMLALCKKSVHFLQLRVPRLMSGTSAA